VRETEREGETTMRKERATEISKEVKDAGKSLAIVTWGF
jgi:hypothetical protein